MRFPQQSGDATLAQAVRATLRSDPLARAALVLLLVSPAAFLLPRSLALRDPLVHTFLPLTLLLLAIVALIHGLRRIARRPERLFWRELALAYAFWLAAETLYGFVSSWNAGGRDLPLGGYALIELLYAAYYAALLLALERQPHRGRWRPSGLEGMLVRPVLVVFILSLFTYFVLVPVTLDPAVYETFMPSAYLYVCLDGFVAIKLWLLARAARGRRWGVLYAMLAVAATATLGGDLLEPLIYGGAAGWSEATAQYLWSIPFTLIVLAARLRHHPFPPEPREERAPASFLSGPAAETLLFSLALPWVHVLGYSVALFEEGARGDRELLVLGSTFLLGGVAIVQQDLFRRRSRELALQRAQIEANLRKSEADLRLMSERRRIAGELREAEERFATVFRLSPSGLLLLRLDPDQVIEVNDRYRALSGREETLAGQSLSELGLGDRELARRLAWRLRSDGRVRDLEGDVRTPAGVLRPVTISAEAFEIDGEACALVVVRDRERTEASA